MSNYDKYKLRKEHTPYRFEQTISNCCGVKLKLYEFFDGEKVKWCISEDYESFSNVKYNNCTPVFDNVTLDNGDDMLRIFYRDKESGRMVVVGKLNGEQVICGVDPGEIAIGSWFFSIHEFNGEKVSVTYDPRDNNRLRIDYQRDGINKMTFFDCEHCESVINETDGIYGNDGFLKSYVVNGKVRAFLGAIDYENATVKPYGYDVNKGEFIKFPTKRTKLFNHYTLIDDEKMQKQLEAEDDIGFDFETYRNADKSFYGSVLKLVGIDYDKGHELTKKLERRNKTNNSKKKA